MERRDFIKTGLAGAGVATLASNGLYGLDKTIVTKNTAFSGFTNINDIRELAIYYQKHKQYPYYDEYLDLYIELNENRKRGEPEIIPKIEDMSYGAQQFAIHWIKRFTNGATIGGIYYSGEHLFYLNVCQIERVISNDSGVFKDNSKKTKKVGIRDMGFPDFWDEDYKYFTGVDIARWGAKVLKDKDGEPTETYVEAYNRIYGNLDTGLIIDESNISGGANHLYLKPRGVGYSWKLGTWNNYNLYLTPNTHNFILADNSEYLGDKDGVMAKFVKIRSFIQDKVWFLRKSFYKQSITDYSFATGYKESIGGSETIKGFNSSVSGVIVNSDTDKSRGKRGNYSFEEFGSFPGVGETWQKTDPSVNEYGVIFGQIRGGGTGGGTGEGYADLEQMTYDPDTYRIIRYKNPWEDAYRGKGIAMFTPAYVNITYKDSNGNSLVAESKKVMDIERENKKLSPDPTVYTNHCAEKPYIPNEAFNAVGNNIFPIDLLKAHLADLKHTNRDKDLCRYGDFVLTESGIKFKAEIDKYPYEAYPVKAGDKEGCIVILQDPFKLRDKVPDNLYVISVDPYSDEEATESPSIGSFCVEEQLNTITRAKGNIEVCWYDGRPEGFDGQDRFCRRLFWAAEYYNAKIVIENNEKGNIVHWAKTHKDTKGRWFTEYLHEQLALGYDIKIATKANMKREYGIHMTEGRKRQGIKDYQEYLLMPRGEKIMPDGSIKILRNLNFIYNRGLLQEAISFNGKNADRISARIVKMFAIKEFEDKRKVIGVNRIRQDSFFSQKLFQ